MPKYRMISLRKRAGSAPPGIAGWASMEAMLSRLTNSMGPQSKGVAEVEKKSLSTKKDGENCQPSVSIIEGENGNDLEGEGVEESFVKLEIPVSIKACQGKLSLRVRGIEEGIDWICWPRIGSITIP
jgi:hypothetical protein